MLMQTTWARLRAQFGKDTGKNAQTDTLKQGKCDKFSGGGGACASCGGRGSASRVGASRVGASGGGASGGGASRGGASRVGASRGGAGRVSASGTQQRSGNHNRNFSAARSALCAAVVISLSLALSACGGAANGAAQGAAGADASVSGAAQAGSVAGDANGASGAGTSGTASQAGNAYYTFTDDLGNAVTLAKQPETVVSLFGSYAEMWLLAGGTLAGVTEDAVSERGMTLAENVSIIGSVKEPNLELILQAQPDFVLLSTDVEAHVKLDETLTQANIAHAYFKEDTVDDYLRVLKIYTDITGRRDLYAQHGDSVKQQIDTLLAGIPQGQEKPSVLLIRSMSTKAKALKDDHMVGEMLADLQADNIASRHASLLEDLSMETILQEDPDYIFVVTMGNVDAAVKTLENGVMANPAWQTLSAVKNGNYYVLPKDLFQYKPNARWGESYSYLEKILYP